MTGSTKPSLIRQIRQLHLKREPLNLTAVKRRHPELLAEVYAVRPFWGWKQALEEAGIDYARINVELEDSCTCLICGAQAAILTFHLMEIHQTTPEEYRKEFPGAEIVCETVRAAQRWSKAAPIIPHWEPLWSWEYVLDRAWEFHRRGWSLNNHEIQQRDRSMYSYIWTTGRRQWDDVLQALGLDPADIRQQAAGAHLSEADVVRKLQQRDREGKSLAASAVAREDMQLANAAIRRFGSYARALEAAGFDPEQVQLRVPKITPARIAQLRREMARVAALHGHPRAIAAAALKKQYFAVVYGKLGNWTKACRKFGIDPADLSLTPYASKAHVLEGLRRWTPVHGASYKRACAKNRSLCTAVYRFVGSWPKAVKEAGAAPSPG